LVGSFFFFTFSTLVGVLTGLILAGSTVGYRMAIVNVNGPILDATIYLSMLAVFIQSILMGIWLFYYKHNENSHKSNVLDAQFQIINEPSSNSLKKEQNNDDEPLIFAELNTEIEELTVVDALEKMKLGNISASGGVYIGVASDKIVANPGTITGSIGVIIRGNNLSELLDKIGIKFETVKSGVFKDILSPDKALSEEGRELLQGLIDESYKQFTEAVAEGRNLPVQEVRKFADGRIFTGTQAKELGLVDEVGDEFVARELAAKMVNIDPKIQPLTFGKKKKKILGLIPGSRMIEKIINNIFFELDSSNKVLWLYKP